MARRSRHVQLYNQNQFTRTPQPARRGAYQLPLILAALLLVPALAFGQAMDWPATNVRMDTGDDLQAEHDAGFPNSPIPGGGLSCPAGVCELPTSDTDDLCIGKTVGEGGTCAIYLNATGDLVLGVKGKGITTLPSDTVGDSWFWNEAGNSPGAESIELFIPDDIPADLRIDLSRIPLQFARLTLSDTNRATLRVEADEQVHTPWLFDGDNNVFEGDTYSVGIVKQCNVATRTPPQWQACSIDADCTNNSPTLDSCVDYGGVIVPPGWHEFTMTLTAAHTEPPDFPNRRVCTQAYLYGVDTFVEPGLDMMMGQTLESTADGGEMLTITATGIFEITQEDVFTVFHKTCVLLGGNGDLATLEIAAEYTTLQVRALD